MTIHLYDLRKADFSIDASFRTLQVHECRVCHALTNRAIWVNCFMGGAHIFCPNEEKSWHYRLQTRRLLLWEPHPASYKKALQEEIDDYLRRETVENDIVGEPDFSQKVNVILHKGFVIGDLCIHPGRIAKSDEKSCGGWPAHNEIILKRIH